MLLPDNAVTHGWIRPTFHHHLQTMIDGQSVVRYLRFRQAVTVDHLELPPLGCSRHPAHITVSMPDPETGRWRMLADIQFPRNPVIAGDGLTQETPFDEVQAYLQQGVDQGHHIDLGGVTTDLLRVECDREHDVWPGHGECNGSIYSVPFGILDGLQAHGDSPGELSELPPYHPVLQVGTVAPTAPEGMTVEVRPDMVYFAGPRLSVGFSLRRPMIKHLGWDATQSGRVAENRLQDAQPFTTGVLGLSGPYLRTMAADYPAHTWTGDVSVVGNVVRYRNLTCNAGVEIDATFTVEEERIRMEFVQRAAQDIPALEAYAWTLMWDATAAMTGAAAIPTLAEGRNGQVRDPMLWAGDGVGGLRCTSVAPAAVENHLQVESFRCNNAVQGGFVLGQRSAPEHVPSVPGCTLTGAWELAVDNLTPVTDATLSPALVQHWASIYSCYRPEFGGFSNNAVSINCHVNQHAPCELAAIPCRETGHVDPLEMYRFTISRALLDGSGYGYHRSHYLDSDPILLSGAGRIYQADQNAEWLQRVEPGIVDTVTRILGTLDESGLAICRPLSGNTGSFRWSSNAMDVVGFGHCDAYGNAWTYRGLRNATALMTALGRPAMAVQCRDAADALRTAFATHLVNPATGWVAGWRSRDGHLHDAAFLWINGPAIAFGLLDNAAAQTALSGLEALRRQVGAGHSYFGIPANLWPIPFGDHILPRHRSGGISSTFEHYTDGSMGACFAPYYLRALQRYGFVEEAASMVRELEEGYTRRYFTGGIGSGVEFLRWDGVPTGYEGTFVMSFNALYGIAIEHGVIQPFDPEWWPASDV